MTQEYIGVKQVTAWPQDKDGQPGYAVKYADGYISWSPKDVFEAAYISIGHVSHLPAHQQRVVGEKAVNDDRIAKLDKFFGTTLYLSLDPAEQKRLVEQRSAMQMYANVLGDRIRAF